MTRRATTVGSRLLVALLIVAWGSVLPAPVAAQAHAAAAVPSVRARQPDLEALGRYIEDARRDWGVPGLAVAIVKDGEVEELRLNVPNPDFWFCELELLKQ